MSVAALTQRGQELNDRSAPLLRTRASCRQTQTYRTCVDRSFKRDFYGPCIRELRLEVCLLPCLGTNEREWKQERDLRLSYSEVQPRGVKSPLKLRMACARYAKATGKLSLRGRIDFSGKREAS
jgi:hypothetical protein